MLVIRDHHVSVFQLSAATARELGRWQDTFDALLGGVAMDTEVAG